MTELEMRKAIKQLLEVVKKQQETIQQLVNNGTPQQVIVHYNRVDPLLPEGIMAYAAPFHSGIVE